MYHVPKKTAARNNGIRPQPDTRPFTPDSRPRQDYRTSPTPKGKKAKDSTRVIKYDDRMR